VELPTSLYRLFCGVAHQISRANIEIAHFSQKEPKAKG